MRWSDGGVNGCFLHAEGREDAGKSEIWFTIIIKTPNPGKGYIIMEIMSTNVTTSTRYRGEICFKTIYFGMIKVIS